MFGSSINQPPKNNPLETNSGNNLEKNKQEILNRLEKRLPDFRKMEEEGSLDTHPAPSNIFLFDPGIVGLPLEKQRVYAEKIFELLKFRKTTMEEKTGTKQYIFDHHMTPESIYNMILLQINKKESENQPPQNNSIDTNIGNNLEKKELPFNSYEEIIQNLEKTIIDRGFSGFKNNSIDYSVNTEVSREKAPKGKFQTSHDMSRAEIVRFGRAQTMSLSQAVDYFTDEIKNGTFDKIGTSRYIFLRDHNGGAPLVSICRRWPDGSIFLGTYPVDMNDKTIEDDPDLAWLG